MSRAGEYIRERVRKEDRGFSTPCWVWQLSTTEKGYARAFVPEFGRVRVYRAAYEICVGPIPEGLVIDHLCRVPACCNPAHLEPVTSAENTRRGICGERRRATHCKNGHALIGDNVLPGHDRRCRICRNAYMRAFNKSHPRDWASEWRRQKQLAAA